MASSSSDERKRCAAGQLAFGFMETIDAPPATAPATTDPAPAPPATAPAPPARDWRAEAVRATREALERATRIWPELALPARIEIGFRLRGHAAGTACIRPPVIQYNAALLERYGARFVETIVPHEVAHIVVDSLHPKRVKPHGREWREVVTRLGGSARVTHDFETKAARRMRRYYYECSCEELHAFIGKSHRRARNGSTRYYCRKCGERLRYSGIEGYE